MVNLNAVIAIASHERPHILQSKTLKLLKRHKVPMQQVHVFVSPQSYDTYVPIKHEWKFNLIGGENASILKTRNNIIKYFDEGVNIIEMDDDVDDLQVTVKGQKNQSVRNLKALFNRSFQMISSGGLFGFNSTTNSFFAGGRDKVGLYSIINSCLGYKNDKRIKLTVPEKEDFERCILFYKFGLPILKRTKYGIKTNYWKNKGGIQDHYNFEKRIKVQKKSAQMLLRKYHWAVRTQLRQNGIVDIRFFKDPLRKYST